MNESQRLSGTGTRMNTNERLSVVCQILRIGDNLVVAIPRQMLDQLHVGEGDEVAVELNADSNCMVITPAPLTAAGVNTEFARQVAEFIDAYRPALEALAK